jgi:hypothetical protein
MKETQADNSSKIQTAPHIHCNTILLMFCFLEDSLTQLCWSSSPQIWHLAASLNTTQINSYNIQKSVPQSVSWDVCHMLQLSAVPVICMVLDTGCSVQFCGIWKSGLASLNLSLFSTATQHSGNAYLFLHKPLWNNKLLCNRDGLKYCNIWDWHVKCL